MGIIEQQNVSGRVTALSETCFSRLACGLLPENAAVFIEQSRTAVSKGAQSGLAFPRSPLIDVKR